MPKLEFERWMKYLRDKPADVPEVQMAVLIATVRNALGGKAKAEDFIFSNKVKSKDKLKPMDASDIAFVMKSIV